jgi:GT2 family glycosyltransferase
MQPVLAVVLLNWHSEQLTLLRAAEVRSWASIDPAVVIVDNESSASSRAALEAEPGIAKLIVSTANRGFAGGNNLGIAWAIEQRFEYILLLNTDACIAEGAVLALLERLDRYPDIAVIGPVLKQRGATEQFLVGGRDIARHGATRTAMAPDEFRRLADYPLHRVDYVPGAVLLARRAAFEQVGLFDEQFFFSGEVADFCRRIRRRGGRSCIDLDVGADHDIGQTAHALRATLYVYYSLRNRFLFARKHYPTMRFWYFARWTMIGAWELAKNIARGRIGTARALALALRDGLRGRVGNRNALFDLKHGAASGTSGR